MVRHLPRLSIAVSLTSLALVLARPVLAETVTIGIGTQDTTTNTVTAGTVVRQLHLLEKYLPTSGKYADIKFELEWQNFTSGPPVTNAMMANKLQFGMMGDYPLIVNGFTFESNPESKSRLIAVAAYSLSGSGNGIVVHKDSPYYDLADRHPTLPGVWTYTHRTTGDRLHAYEVDYATSADYYKGDPEGGYQAFVFTDHLSSARIVHLRDWLERDVRAKLNIAFNPAAATIRYEHSMGQGLPEFIYRATVSRTAETTNAVVKNT